MSETEMDFLDEIVSDSTARNPEFPKLVEFAHRRRQKLRALAALRTRRGLTPTQVAARMRTSQSRVALIESGDVDTKLSTLEKYAQAIGARFAWTIETEQS